MKFLQKIFLVTGLCLMVSGLFACGRYSEPSPIESSNFPHNYPQH